VAIGIIFCATRIIFKYSLTSAYVFQIPHRYGERGFPPSETSDFEGEGRNWIYFRFQIDVFNIEFYFHFIEIAHYCTGFPSPDGTASFYKVIFHLIKDIVNSRK
jgi:hypothetical protein